MNGWVTLAAPGWIGVLAALGAVLGSMGLGGVLKTWLDHRRGMRKATDEVAMGLVDKLEARVAKLEGDIAHERAVCDAELKVMRHRLNNVAASFDALMMMIELAPERSAEIIKLVKERRALQQDAEALERAAVAAVIATAASRSSEPATPPE